MMHGAEGLNFHPLVNTGTPAISREGLLKFLEATRAPAADRTQYDRQLRLNNYRISYGGGLPS